MVANPNVYEARIKKPAMLSQGGPTSTHGPATRAVVRVVLDYLRAIMKFCMVASATENHWFWSWRKRFHGS